MSLVACYRNTTTCQWEYYDRDGKLEYDIWLVNGNPNTSGLNSLTYQFSYDRQNTIELYLLFFMCYIILVPLQLYAVRLQKHPVTRLFTASLLLEFVAVCLILIHVLKVRPGRSRLRTVGSRWRYFWYSIACKFRDRWIYFCARFHSALTFAFECSQTSFMLLLLLLAKGWAVTRMELTWKPLVFAIWLCYGVVHILLYVWNMVCIFVHASAGM